MRPGSILESLYPCSDHAPDRCSSCGMSFLEHLEQWWKPRLQSPFDAYLDKTNKNGLQIIDSNASPPRGRRKKAGKLPLEDSFLKVLCFHRSYVQEASTGVKSKQSLKTSKDNAETPANKKFEEKKEFGISYLVPSFKRGNMPVAAWKVNLLYFARAAVLNELGKLLFVQKKENALLQTSGEHFRWRSD